MAATDPDIIAEECGLAQIEAHGDSSTWKYLGKKKVPATDPGRFRGSSDASSRDLENRQGPSDRRRHYFRQAESRGMADEHRDRLAVAAGAASLRPG